LARTPFILIKLRCRLPKPIVNLQRLPGESLGSQMAPAICFALLHHPRQADPSRPRGRFSEVP